MKKTLYLAVFVCAMPLAACGGSSSQSLIPDGGKSIAVSSGATVLNQAMVGVSASTNLGFTLTDGTFSVAAKTYDVETSEVSTEAATSSYQLASINASASLKNFSASLLAEGLTATDVADVKASATFTGDIAYDIDMVEPSSLEIKASQSQSGVTASAYLSNGSVYLDASSQALVSLINTLEGQVLAHTSQSFTSISGGKYNLGTLLTSASLPLLSTDTITSIQQSGAVMASAVSSLSSYFKSVQYDDGSYGLSISLTKDDLMAMVLDLYNKGNQTSVSSLPSSISDLFSGLTITSLGVGIVYTESGLKTVTTDIDVAYAGTLAQSLTLSGESVALSSTDAAKSVSYSLVCKETMKVLTGADVKVTFPDFGDYSSIQRDE